MQGQASRGVLCRANMQRTEHTAYVLRRQRQEPALGNVQCVHTFRSMWSWVAFQSRPTARALSANSWKALWQQVCLDFKACVSADCVNW